METAETIRSKFGDLFLDEKFVTDKTGCKMLEIIGVSVDTEDVDAIFGKLNTDYVQREIDWYNSRSLNVNDIAGKTPKAWIAAADRYGNINSNYGWVIYSDENFSQFKYAKEALLDDSTSRRAIMIYNRPSMQVEFNKGSMSDFICTNSSQLFIRNNKLECVVNQRSSDIVFGYKNDRKWHRHVQGEMLVALSTKYPDLEIGKLIMQFGSLHAYEKHFKFISEYLANR